MTIEEAIRTFELIANDYRNDIKLVDGKCSMTYTKKELEKYELAITALKEKKEREVNGALTLNELSHYRKNNLPVFIKTINIKNEPCGWALAGTRGAISQDIVDCPLWYDAYGIYWIAYKYPISVTNEASV